MKIFSCTLITAALLTACGNNHSPAGSNNPGDTGSADNTFKSANGMVDSLPAPFATKSVKSYSNVIGWPEGKLPIAPEGFVVSKFAGGLDNPRWIYQGPNGDIFVAQSNTEVKGLKKLVANISPVGKSQKLGGKC